MPRKNARPAAKKRKDKAAGKTQEPKRRAVLSHVGLGQTGIALAILAAMSSFEGGKDE